MNELVDLRRARLPQGLDLRVEREKRIKEIRSLALAMSEAARFIPDVLAEVKLTPEREKEFRDLARVFQDQSQQLHLNASELSVNGLEEELDAIRKTCDTCHNQFRVLPAATGF